VKPLICDQGFWTTEFNLCNIVLVTECCLVSGVGVVVYVVGTLHQKIQLKNQYDDI